MAGFPPIAVIWAASHPIAVFDWTDLFYLLPWRMQLGCLVIVVLACGLLILWAYS